MSQDINALREALFAQLAELRAADTHDPDKLKAAISKAGAVSELAKTITDTARVEVDYLRHTGDGDGRSKFLGGAEDDPMHASGSTGITGITRHLLSK